MKAKKKPLEEKTPGRLRRRRHAAAEGASRPSSPRTRKAGVKVGSVDELVEKLKTEAGVL